jgi:hypothetical protein
VDVNGMTGSCGARKHDPLADLGLCGVVVLVDEPAEDGGSSDAAGGLRYRRVVSVVSFWWVLA